jgi:hypothetical protein
MVQQRQHVTVRQQLCIIVDLLHQLRCCVCAQLWR